MNKKIPITALIVLLAAGGGTGVFYAHAQTMQNAGQLNQSSSISQSSTSQSSSTSPSSTSGASTTSGSSSTSGTSVNNMGSPGSYYSGWYTLPSGHQVYYYGNGTYYDPTTHTYGGSVNSSNVNGSAGMSAVNQGVSNSRQTPGVPNTGVGGDAPVNWALLLTSAIAALGGVIYVKRLITIY